MDETVAKYVISVNTLIKADFLESENLGREPFVLSGNAGQREISSKARNPAHMFSRNGSFAFSAKEARWQLLFFWTHLVLLAVSPAATGSPPHSRSRSMSRWKCPEISLRISSKISVRLARPWHGLVVGPEVCSGLPRWTHLDRGETGAACWGAAQQSGACCSQAQDSASQGMERFSGFSQIFSEESILGLAENFPGIKLFWTKTEENVLDTPTGEELRPKQN